MLRKAVDVVRENSKLVIGIPALVGLLAIGLGLATPREYEGAIVVTPVSNRPGGNASLAATVLGAGALGDFQSSPILVSRIARLDGVLLAVAKDTVDDKGHRIIDRMRGEGPGAVDDRAALAAMRKVVSSAADLQSGLVTIRVTARDSGLVRRITNRVLAQTSAAFVNTTRAQASALKHSQDARLANAQRRLAEAEDAMRTFRTTNRRTSEYSVASLVEQRLQRELNIATELHSQAVSAREGAAARELEEAPALVVVDGLPDQLQPKPRGLLLKAITWSLLAGAVLFTVLLGKAHLAEGDEQTAPARRDQAREV